VDTGEVFNLAFARLIGEKNKKAGPDGLSPRVVDPSLDPLQFAYQPRIGVEDAIIVLLPRGYNHLAESHVLRLLKCF